jgi:16S rRNA A1518/A1519 N6-dimethyltransferase RsmA/KsgA/DIM1 with predicted DNA glycosylase/AP lyase activity
VSEIKPNLIFDIGLHQGEDTEFYLEKGFEVVAFEADPVLADQCRRKFSDQIADQRLVIVEGAIVDVRNCGSA